MAALAAPLRADDKIEVKVISVLASSQHTNIDERLKGLAPELKKKNETWTGFEVGLQNKKSMKIGDTETFSVADKVEVSVTLKARNEDGTISVVVKTPKVGEIGYSCCCSKYVPFITRHETPDNKTLVVAVMVQPCKKKEPAKPDRNKPKP